LYAAVGSSTNLQNQIYLTYCADPKTDGAAGIGTYSSTTYNTFLEQNVGLKTRKFDKPISLYWKPKIFESTGSGGAKLRTPGWLSLMTDANESMNAAQFFMHDYAFGALNASSFGCDMQYTIYFQCRGAN